MPSYQAIGTSNPNPLIREGLFYVYSYHLIKINFQVSWLLIPTHQSPWCKIANGDSNHSPRLSGHLATKETSICPTTLATQSAAARTTKSVLSVRMPGTSDGAWPRSSKASGEVPERRRRAGSAFNPAHQKPKDPANAGSFFVCKIFFTAP